GLLGEPDPPGKCRGRPVPGRAEADPRLIAVDLDAPVRPGAGAETVALRERGREAAALDRALRRIVRRARDPPGRVVAHLDRTGPPVAPLHLEQQSLRKAAQARDRAPGFLVGREIRSAPDGSQVAARAGGGATAHHRSLDRARPRTAERS